MRSVMNWSFNQDKQKKKRHNEQDLIVIRKKAVYFSEKRRKCQVVLTRPLKRSIKSAVAAKSWTRFWIAHSATPFSTRRATPRRIRSTTRSIWTLSATMPFLARIGKIRLHSPFTNVLTSFFVKMIQHLNQKVILNLFVVHHLF
jgi:hypothetical protein